MLVFQYNINRKVHLPLLLQIIQLQVIMSIRVNQTFIQNVKIMDIVKIQQNLQYYFQQLLVEVVLQVALLRILQVLVFVLVILLTLIQVKIQEKEETIQKPIKIPMNMFYLNLVPMTVIQIFQQNILLQVMIRFSVLQKIKVIIQ